MVQGLAPRVDAHLGRGGGTRTRGPACERRPHSRRRGPSKGLPGRRLGTSPATDQVMVRASRSTSIVISAYAPSCRSRRTSPGVEVEPQGRPASGPIQARRRLGFVARPSPVFHIEVAIHGVVGVGQIDRFAAAKKMCSGPCSAGPCRPAGHIRLSIARNLMAASWSGRRGCGDDRLVAPSTVMPQPPWPACCKSPAGPSSPSR